TPEDENPQNTKDENPQNTKDENPQNTKDENLQNIKGLEQEELEAYAANNAAEQLQGLDRRDPVPRSQPEGPPSAEEVAAHNLTHVPFQRWCESCVATRSRADAHHTGANRETKVPVVQIDFYFTSLDDHARPAGQGEQDTCCLIGVDLETKMVLSVPGPNKGAVILHRAAEEVTRFTISLHGDEAVILQSDGEPAIKAVARAVAAARNKLGKKTVQRTTPVAAHQSNGGAERAVQTVRRLGTCLFHALELKAGTFPADTPLKLWAQVHGAFLYNRFHVLPGVLQTPYELAYGGRKFTKALCHKGEPRWIKGLWVGMSTTSGANHLMTTYGHIQSESVRRATEEQQLTANQVEDMCITGWPWNRDHVEQPRRRKKEPRRAEAAPTLEAGVQLPLGAPPGHPLLPEEDNEAQAVEAAAKGRGAFEKPVAECKTKPVESQEPIEAEEMSGGGGADATTEPAEVVHQPGPDEAMDADEEFAVRMVETVDAAWHEAWENTAYGEAEDFDGEQPPDLSPEDLAELDDQAEIEELTCLEGMNEQAEHLSTVFVKTWKKGPDGWFRRARLVARQYRWASDMLEEDTFSPASVSTLARLVPLLAQKWGTPIYIMDVKDAYLCVPQPEDEPVVVTAPRSYVNKFGASKTWKLGRVLPGQRRGAQEWCHQLAGDLNNANLESMPEVPTLYRASGSGERYVAQVHVDDIMATGDAEPHGRVEKDLTNRYTVKIAGPYQQPGDEFEFLKRRYQIQSDGSITVRAP
ncbi:RE1, partial [Symbiodinium necroappetens]